MEDPIPLDVITSVISQLHSLATQFPSALTQEIFSFIETSRKRLALSLTSNHVFPTAQELVLFYTIGQIYPTSDRSHIIVNPATLFMGQILGQMRVRNVQDLARGLFVCSIFLQYQSLAKRLCPEVVNFINLTLVKLIAVNVEGLPDTRLENGNTSLQLQASEVTKEIPPKMSFSALYSNKNDPQTKIQALDMAIELVDTATDLWKSVTAFPELFHSAQQILTKISNSKIHSSLPSSMTVSAYLKNY
jgi:nucleolar protein 14